MDNKKSLQAIIFSFNRPLQLETLIDSIFENIHNINLHITVIYNCTNDRLQKGYDIVSIKYGEKVEFLKEEKNTSKYKIKDFFSLRNVKTFIKQKTVRNPKTNFRDLVIYSVENNRSDYTVFFTDDSVLFQEFNFSQNIENFLDSDLMNNSFSLRLGKNVDDGYFRGVKKGNFMYWNFSDSPTRSHWGYRFSVDGHIYSYKAISYLVKKLIYANPNTMEPSIHEFAFKKGILRYGMCSLDSCLIAFPLNEVNTVCPDNVHQQISIEMLNDRLIEGWHLNYDIPPKSDIERFPHISRRIFFKRDNVTEEYVIKSPIEYNFMFLPQGIELQLLYEKLSKTSTFSHIIFCPDNYKITDDKLSKISLKLDEFEDDSIIGIAFLLNEQSKLYPIDAYLTPFTGDFIKEYCCCLSIKKLLLYIENNVQFNIRCFNRCYTKIK